MRFSPDGKRLIITSHAHNGIKEFCKLVFQKVLIHPHLQLMVVEFWWKGNETLKETHKQEGLHLVGPDLKYI